MPTLRQKVIHLCALTLLLFFGFNTSIYAAQMVAQRSGYSLDSYGDLNYILVALASLVGGIISALVPTAIDAQMKFSPARSKMFIGFFFGLFSCWAADRHYDQYTALDFVFPALIASAIGSPVMVYLINIANDPQTWKAFKSWLFRRFGFQTPPSSGGTQT